MTDRWDVGLMGNVLYSPQGGSRQYALGVETGVLVMENLWLSLGYNWRGFKDRDLSGSDYTARGLYLRLRWKFDEDLFEKKSR